MAPGDSSPEKTAPAPLHLVQRFVNSVDLETGEDELTSPEALRDWLAERGLMGTDEAVRKADLRRAVDVREGLRALLLANSGLPVDSERIERLDAAVAHAGMRMRFRAGSEPALEPDAGGVDGALGRLMAIVSGAVEQGGWQRLKACHRDPCFWAFYDNSKNRSGRWCKMEACGNIEKARAFRERRRGSAPA
ncbi:MAG TPA: CGNR zinc finger domain-containing protein [Thermoleophilaceae bacterium]|nr:CGNR zinc finger domain-containing protein [Thermoleophilaceae bacterium]